MEGINGQENAGDIEGSTGGTIDYQKHRYVKIHVCQASYGDCLAMEFDNQAATPGSLGLRFEESVKENKGITAITPGKKKPKGSTKIQKDKDKAQPQPKMHKLVLDDTVTAQREKDASRKVILIDGGPANYGIQGTRMKPLTPLANMYAMLNSLLPPGSPNALDTLVITHDDADHITGIHQLMISMIAQSGAGSGNGEFRFHNGVEALKAKQSPFRNIWYNSPTLLFKNPDAKGWFDTDLETMKAKWKEAAANIPGINEDFGGTIVTGPGENRTAGKATRAHLTFDFLSPNSQQLATLGMMYMKVKKVKGTDGIDEEVDDDTEEVKQESQTEKVEDLPKLAENIQGVEWGKRSLPNAAGRRPVSQSKAVAKAVKLTPRNLKLIAGCIDGPSKDTSAKNQSSLVFTVKDDLQTFSAVFTGDGNAVSSFLPIWTGKPLEYDVLKIMHHGSRHNNCWGKKAVFDRIQKVSGFRADLAITDDSDIWKTKVPDKCKTEGQDEPSRFFLNVRAKHYIISSSTTEGHRNPHLSTLAGIITRAIVINEGEPINIYLTSQSLQVQVLGFVTIYGPDLADAVIDEDTIITEKLLSAVMLKPPKNDGKPELYWDDGGERYRIWQLRAEIEPKYGTIMFKPKEEDTKIEPKPFEPKDEDPMLNPCWQRVALTSRFWLTYHETYFSTTPQKVIGRPAATGSEESDHDEVKQKRGRESLKPSRGNKPRRSSNRGRPPTGRGKGGGPGSKDADAERSTDRGKRRHSNKRDRGQRTVGRERSPTKKKGRSTSRRGRRGGISSMEPDADESGVMSNTAEPETTGTTNMLMSQESGTVPKDSLTTNISDVGEVAGIIKDMKDLQFSTTWSLAVGPHGLSPATFARFDIRISELIYNTISIQQGSETKTLIGTDAFLHYLSLRGWLLPDQLTALKVAHMRENQITLGGIMSLVFDKFLKISFFSLLPIRLDNKSLFSSTPTFWPLSGGLKAAVLSTPKQRALAHDFSDVKSLSFTVKPPVPYQRWDMQYRLPSGQMAMWQVKIVSELGFFIYRPFERHFRYVYGSFLGKLSNGDGSNVIIDFIWFPDKDTGLDYHVRFADNNFVADGNVMTVGDLFSIIPPCLSTVNTLAAAILLPGKDTSIAFGDLVKLQDGGFVVSKISPIIADVTLNRIFGTISFDKNQEFKPFGDMITIRPPTIGLQLENLFSTVPMRVFVRIEETLDIRGFPVPVVFETRRSRGGDQTVYQLSYIASSPEQSLTPARLLDWLGIPVTDLSDIPGLQKLLNRLHVLSFGLGWFGGHFSKSRTESFSANPNFIELAIQLDRLELVPEYLAVNNAFLELRLDRSASEFNTSFTSHARLTIGDCEVQFLISYGKRPEWESVYAYDGIRGHFRLALSTEDTGVLSLSSILGHFMPNIQCLPPALSKVLTRTGISKFRLGVDKDDNGKNKIAMIDLEVIMEEDDMEIFEGLSISNPTLKLRIDYPNDKDSRKISASINARAEIGDQELTATLWVDAQEDTLIDMSIVPTNESIAMEEVIMFFIRKMSETFTLNMPSDFSFMRGIDAGPMHVSFRKTAETGYRLNSLFLQVEVNRDFELWDSPRVAFSDAKFLANYIRGSGVHVAFGVSLAIGSYEFSGSLTYDRSSNEQGSVQEHPDNVKPVTQDKDNVVALGRDKSTAYTAEVEFRGEIGLHNMLSKLTGSSFTEILQQTGLEALSKYTDIKIHSVGLILTRSPLSWTFSITADLEWLAFTKASLTASHEASWAFDLQLQCKDGPLRILPDSWARTVARYVEFGDTSIYLFYGPIRNTLRGSQLTLSNKSRTLLGINGGVAISTSLNFGSDLKILREWLSVDGLQISGAAGAGFFTLGVRVGQLSLMNDAFKLTGGFLLSYINEQLWIGLEGDFEFNIPAITRSTIAGTVAAGVNLTSGRLSLKYNSPNALRDIGGIKGFDLDAFALEIELAPEAELMPTTVGVEGGVRIEGLDNIYGHLAVNFVAQNPLNCYVEGRIENLNLTGLLAKFAAAIDLPSELRSFLQKNGVNFQFLAIQLIPKDMIGMTDQVLKRRIHFEGALSIVIDGKPIWAGFVLLGIKDSTFTAISLMEPIQLIDPEVFSLQRSLKGVSAAAYNLQLPQVDPGYLTTRMLNEGPVLKIASEGPDPVLISARLRFLGTEHDLYASVNGDSFIADFHSKSSVGTLDFSINCFFKSAISITASATLDLGEHTLTLATTLKKMDGALGQGFFKKASSNITSVGFSGTLKIGVAWVSGQNPLLVSLTGKAQAFDKNWDIGEIGMKITEHDLRNLEVFSKQLWEYIKTTFTDLVTSWIHNAGTEVSAAIKFLQNNWEVANQELVRLVSDIKGLPTTDIIGPVIRELDMVYKEAFNLYKDLGIDDFMGVRNLSFIYGTNPPPDRRPSWEPSVPPLDHIFKFPTPSKPDDVIQPVISRDDVIAGFPGVDVPPQKPVPSPVPAPKPAEPVELPDDIGFPFSAEPDFTSLLETEPEDGKAATPHSSARAPEDIVVARVPAWYMTEIERYVSYPTTAIASDSIDDTIAHILIFNREEVVAATKTLRNIGLSDSEIQQAYKREFGRDMPQEMIKAN